VEASDRGAYTLTVAEGAVPTAISPGSSVEGSLEATDEQVDGRFSDRYVLTGQAGQSVTFTLNSESFDAYLVLIDPDGNPAENDDLSEETTDAELTYLFDRDGSVELQVTSYDSGESGPYILTVNE
ncbi:hypothetical protein, partial [Salinispira pacifica]